MPTLYEARQKRKMRAKMGRLRLEGRAYAAQTWRARMASTRTSERFLGSRGSRSCETMSWVSGTTKTVRGRPGQCAFFSALGSLHRSSFGVIWKRTGPIRCPSICPLETGLAIVVGYRLGLVGRVGCGVARTRCRWCGGCGGCCCALANAVEPGGPDCCRAHSRVFGVEDRINRDKR